MSKIYNGGLNFSYGFNIKANAPIDSRYVVDSFNDIADDKYKQVYIDDSGSIFYYEGMLVYAKTEHKLYILKDLGNDVLRFEELGSGSTVSNLTNLFTYSGSKNAVTQLDQATADDVGKVYNIKEAFTVVEPVIDADGNPSIEYADDYSTYTLKTEVNSYPKGTNVVGYAFKYYYSTPKKNDQDEIVYKTDENDNPVYILDAEGNSTGRPLPETVLEEAIEYRWDALGGDFSLNWINVN